MFLDNFLQAYHTHIFIWTGITIIAILLESLIKGKPISLWFAVGSIFSLTLALLHITFTIQFIAFFVISIILIILNEFYFMKQKQG